MRTSYYNVEVRNDDGSWTVHNCATGALVQVSEGVHEALACEGAGCDGLGDLGALVEAGVLVEEPEEQVRAISARYEAARLQRDELCLCIAPTLRCNLACVYCYEPQGQAAPGDMGDEVIEGIFALIEQIYRRDGFTRLSIQWYGGEPTLCLGTMRAISSWCREFAARNGVSFGAELISNCSLVDDEVARILHDECCVGFALPTVDGPAERHNRRRPLKGGGASYDAVLRGIRALVGAGVRVTASVNMDGRMFDEFEGVRDTVAELGAGCSCCALCDYRGTFGTAGFEEPEFQMISHEEYARRSHELFTRSGFDAAAVADLLRPMDRFCRGSVENYFVIGPTGDVCKCDGWIGTGKHVLFNLREPQSDDALLDMVRYNPTEDPECRTCRVLPQCMGHCRWNREVFNGFCHYLKVNVEDYVRDYRGCFGAAEGDVCVLVG
ncbi:MAG: radical SAM protein [Coriobacteriia bacterium]|nr:radical SAM protein [Coriobacteriia bacterium]